MRGRVYSYSGTECFCLCSVVAGSVAAVFPNWGAHPPDQLAEEALREDGTGLLQLLNRRTMQLCYRLKKVFDLQTGGRLETRPVGHPCPLM